ncbi:MAG: zf-HC2 domain-containing protein [Deltaproteobacteria bacterium]|nr:zf-HC2 domain-containing protein [Deltaproteobacteria bacterium]
MAETAEELAAPMTLGTLACGNLECAKIVTHLTDFLEGDLCNVSQEKFCAHLRECPECATWAESVHLAGNCCKETLMSAMPCGAEDRLLSFLKDKCKCD